MIGGAALKSKRPAGRDQWGRKLKDTESQPEVALKTTRDGLGRSRSKQEPIERDTFGRNRGNRRPG